MKTKLKKIFVLVLAIVMLISSIPVSVFAVDTAENSNAETVVAEENATDVSDDERKYTIDDVIAGAITIDEYEAYLEELYAIEEEPGELYLPKVRSLIIANSSDVTVAVGRENFYRQGHIKRDYIKEKDELNKVVYKNADGTYTQYVFNYPVKFKDENGKISDVSLKVVSDENGGFKTHKGNSKVHFPKNVKDGISISGNGVSVDLKPNGISSTAESTDEYNVSYIYDESTILDYSLTYTGIKEDIVVYKYTGQTEYEFTLNTNGLKPEKIDGSYFLINDNGEIKGTIGDIIILTADGKNNAMGYMTHYEVVPNEQYIITVHVDDEYLSDPKTKYPIRIDPTIEISYNTACDIDDATIYSDGAMDGTGNELYVGKKDGKEARILMRFYGRLSDIPSARHVNSASFYMTNLSTGNTAMDTENMTLMVYMYNGGSWDENSEYISNADFYSNTQYMSSKDINTVGTRYGFGITNAIKNWINWDFSLAQGIVITARDVAQYGSNMYKSFASFNATYGMPSLWVNYSETETYTSAPFGWFDKVDENGASGWVWCFDEPDQNLGVKLYIENLSNSSVEQHVVYTVANVPRPDVNAKGYYDYTSENGGGDYGFSHSIDWSEYPRGYYRITAKAFLDEDRNQVSDTGTEYTITLSPKYYQNYTNQPLEEGDYYINNTEHGKYLRNNSGNEEGKSGTLDNLGNTIKWYLKKYDSGYTITAKDNPNLYLAAAQDMSNNGVELITVEESSTIPARCVWDMSINGGCLLRNRHNSNYLTCDVNGTLTTAPIYSSITQPALRRTQTWRVPNTRYYGNTSLSSHSELQIGFSIDALIVGIEKSKFPVINKTLNNVLWAEPSDFIYEFHSGTADCITFDSAMGKAYANKVGIAVFYVKHKVTNQSCYMKIYVDEYTHLLVSYFDFSEEVSLLIRSIYDRIDDAFDSVDNIRNAWKASRLLSSFCYEGLIWGQVAGNVVSIDERQDYFTNILEYTRNEYNLISSAIVAQHVNTQTSDFAHMQYSLSARLAFELGTDGILADIGQFCVDEDVSYMGGWLGDATLADNGTTTMGNDDYCADLDAENIFRYINGSVSSIDAINTYYGELTDTNTRADVFLSHIEYNFVKTKVFYYLIDMDLYNKLSLATQQNNTYLINYYIALLEDEEYHMNVLLENYIDTYNFLLSLQNGLADIGSYE